MQPFISLNSISVSVGISLYIEQHLCYVVLVLRRISDEFQTTNISLLH